jgi:ABC-2 type transport system permease protein
MEVNMMKRILFVFRQFGLYMQANLRNAMELKVAFWLDVVGMALNNVAFVVTWIFFFMQVGSVNGWSSVETIGLNGMVALVYGLTFAFAGGASTLAHSVNSGSFDNYLLSPVNLYIRILSSYSRTSAFGDMLYGVILMIIFVIIGKLSLLGILLLILLVPLCALIMVNFVLVSSLISFLIPDTADVASNLFELMISPSLYPSGLYSKGMKLFFLVVIPAIAVAGAPVELMRNPTWGMFLLITGLSIFWTFLAIFLLKKAIKRYESGNLMGFKG